MKLSYQDKLEIYRLWKEEHLGCKRIAKIFNLTHSTVFYWVNLIDIHGKSIAKKTKYREYSSEFKQAAVDRVLVNHESILQVSLSIGLPGKNQLSVWVKSYLENGYNGLKNKKRGRHAKNQETNTETEQTNSSSTARDFETSYRERILKKIRCLNYRTRKARAEAIAEAISELRRKLKCSLKFILDTINSIEDVPHMTRSVYYYTINKTDKDEKNKELIAKIIEVFNENKQRYGYRRIVLVLKRIGIIVNHKKVQRIMRKYCLKAICPRRKYRSYKGDLNGTVNNKLLIKIVDKANTHTYYERNFATTKVNQKWTTDVSEFSISAGKLYLSPILDMHNSEIVSYSISYSPNFSQTLEMLNNAFKVYKNLNGLIFHSDQGWQYVKN